MPGGSEWSGHGPREETENKKGKAGEQGKELQWPTERAENEKGKARGHEWGGVTDPGKGRENKN